MFTDKQKRVYVKAGIRMCPKCKSESISSEWLNTKYTFFTYRQVFCNDCKVSWEEQFDLVDIVENDG